MQPTSPSLPLEIYSLIINNLIEDYTNVGDVQFPAVEVRETLRALSASTRTLRRMTAPVLRRDAWVRTEEDIGMMERGSGGWLSRVNHLRLSIIPSSLASLTPRLSTLTNLTWSASAGTSDGAASPPQTPPSALFASCPRLMRVTASSSSEARMRCFLLTLVDCKSLTSLRISLSKEELAMKTLEAVAELVEGLRELVVETRDGDWGFGSERNCALALAPLRSLSYLRLPISTYAKPSHVPSPHPSFHQPLTIADDTLDVQALQTLAETSTAPPETIAHFTELLAEYASARERLAETQRAAAEARREWEASVLDLRRKQSELFFSVLPGLERIAWDVPGCGMRVWHAQRDKCKKLSVEMEDAEGFYREFAARR